MCPPKHHLGNDFEKAKRIIARFPLATLISTAENELFTTPVPILLTESGKLEGHIDKSNPQWQTLTQHPVKLIFQGPNAYISPSVYRTTQLPTWNYAQVHLKGDATLMEDPEAIKRLLIRTNKRLEQGQQTPFLLPADHPKMNALLKFIVGFEVKIIDWELRLKLSQDKNPEDQQLALDTLITNDERSERMLLEYLLKS